MIDKFPWDSLNKVIDYIIQGTGRRTVPEDVYSAAWKIAYRLKNIKKKGEECKRKN